MADAYAKLVETGPLKKLAESLGLPRPSTLRRHRPGDPLVPGPVLLLGTGPGAEELAGLLLGWDLEVRRHALPGEKLGAILLALDDARVPADLAGIVLPAGEALRQLAPGGRVVTLSRPASAEDPAPTAATRQGVDGFLRSLAKELRGGATGNGILVAQPLTIAAPEVAGVLRFLLSGRSAFVDGQLLTVQESAPAIIGAGAAAPQAERPLAGRVALVTGAARGIGAEIARTLRRDGAEVIGVDVPAAGDALARLVNDIGGTALQLDITAEDAGARMLELARQRFGSLDIVVHNAGVTRDKLLANMDAAKWASVLAVNLEAQLRINEALLGSPVFRRSPRIVSLSSTSGIAGNRGQTNYATSKAGVIGATRATASRMAQIDGTINAVAPGFIETAMTARMPFATREVARRLNSLQQGGLPLDVAETVAFLASPEAGGVNGQCLRVCGQNMVGA